MFEVIFVIESESLYSTADDSAKRQRDDHFVLNPEPSERRDSMPPKNAREHKESKRDLSGIFLFNQRF